MVHFPVGNGGNVYPSTRCPIYIGASDSGLFWGCSDCPYEVRLRDYASLFSGLAKDTEEIRKPFSGREAYPDDSEPDDTGREGWTDDPARDAATDARGSRPI